MRRWSPKIKLSGPRENPEVVRLWSDTTGQVELYLSNVPDFSTSKASS